MKKTLFYLLVLMQLGSSSEVGYVEDQIIVKFGNNYDRTGIEQILEDSGFTLQKHLVKKLQPEHKLKRLKHQPKNKKLLELPDLELHQPKNP